MKKIFVLVSMAALVIGLAVGDVSSVNAQESGVGDEFTLEEITVTAQKREENQQKVAIAMDVISGEDISVRGMNNIDDILSSASAALIQKAPDGYRITIRGISDDSSAFKGLSLATPTVAMNIDGVLSNRKDTGTGLYDLERVEVLYGPQSTLYASNSPGGIVNVVTALPKTNIFEGSVSIGYGDYKSLPIEGTINIPLGDEVAIRAAVTASKHDGYLSNGSDDEDIKSARLRALWQPNDKIYFVITGEGTNDKGSGFGGGAVAFENQDDPDDPWTGAASDNQAGRDIEYRKFYAQMNWDTDFATIGIVTAYSSSRGDSISQFVVPGFQLIEYMKWQARDKNLEVRMTSPADFPFKWILGGTYYRSKDSQRLNSEDFLLTGEGTWGYRVMSEVNKNLFTNITYPVNDKFRVTVGYRKSWDDMISDNEENMLAGEGSTGYAYENIHLVCSTEGAADYKFGIEYDLGENSMIYADYSTSYRLQSFGSSYAPEDLKTYTLGNKNRFFGNKLQLNWAAFYYDYQNYRAERTDRIVWVVDTDDDLVEDRTEQARDTANTYGNGTMHGFDISTSWLITSQDRVDLTTSYQNSEWTDLFLDYDYTETLELVDGELVTRTLTDLDYKGKTMLHSPPWTINLTYNHTFYLQNGGAINASVNSKFMTSYNLSWQDADLPWSYQEAHHIENINVVYDEPKGRWTLSAYMNNVFNYAEKRMYLMGSDTVALNNPRTFGAKVSFKF